MPSSQPVSDLTDHVGFWLRMVSNHVSHAFAAKLADKEVTVAEWSLMRALYGKEPMPPSRLADAMGMSRGAITKLANRLIAKLLVIREASVDDGRAQTLALTDRGSALVPDLAALADRNGIAAAAVKQQAIGAAVREPMLAAGQVDAVTGFSYLSAVNLRDRGIPADDLTVLRFADYGCPAYGAALIVNPKFAADQPEAVRAFLRATVKGLRQTIQNPGAAIDERPGRT